MLGRLSLRGGHLLRGLLVPRQLSLTDTAGFKVRVHLKLRCRHCYFIRVNGRLHVECPESPRHKAREPFNTKLLW